MKDLAYPEIPEHSIVILSECTASAEPEPAECMADLISKMQIHRAGLVRMRTELLDRGYVNRMSLNQYMVDSIEVYTRASNLFAYARRQAETVSPVSPSTMQSCINISEIFAFPEVMEMVGRFGSEES
jgi:hypothetical protein